MKSEKNDRNLTMCNYKFGDSTKNWILEHNHATYRKLGHAKTLSLLRRKSHPVAKIFMEAEMANIPFPAQSENVWNFLTRHT